MTQRARCDDHDIHAVVLCADVKLASRFLRVCGGCADLQMGGTEHVGMVVNVWYKPAQRYLIVHNIGAGPKLEDVLFDWKLTGHYRYFGPAGRAARAQKSQSFIHS